MFYSEWGQGIIYFSFLFFFPIFQTTTIFLSHFRILLLTFFRFRLSDSKSYFLSLGSRTQNLVYNIGVFTTRLAITNSSGNIINYGYLKLRRCYFNSLNIFLESLEITSEINSIKRCHFLGLWIYKSPYALIQERESAISCIGNDKIIRLLS